MCVAAPDTIFRIVDETIETVDKFKYLRAIITRTGGSLDDAGARIATARGTMTTMKRLWAANHISSRGRWRKPFRSVKYSQTNAFGECAGWFGQVKSGSRNCGE